MWKTSGMILTLQQYSLSVGFNRRNLYSCNQHNVPTHESNDSWHRETLHSNVVILLVTVPSETKSLKEVEGHSVERYSTFHLRKVNAVKKTFS